MSGDAKVNWREIVIRTDGLRWSIDSKKTNSSFLEIKEICKEILKKFNLDKPKEK